MYISESFANASDSTENASKNSEAQNEWISELMNDFSSRKQQKSDGKGVADLDLEKQTQPQERQDQRELTEADIANEIAKSGKIPDGLKKALERGVDPDGKGIDIAKINKALEKLGNNMQIELRPGAVGLEIELKKDGKTIDLYEAATPEARDAADRMRRAGSVPERNLPPDKSGHIPPQYLQEIAKRLQQVRSLK